MPNSRILWPLLLFAAVTACSGNLGGGQSTLPGAPQGSTNVQQVAAPAPTSIPVSASNVATIGDSVAAQALPTVMGWGGTIAFPKPNAAASPAPNSKASAATGNTAPNGPVSIGITAAVVEPADAPHFGSADAKGRRPAGKHAGGIKGLLYVSLLSTADVTLSEYPQLGIDVPRDIAAKYRDQTFGLALYDPEAKLKGYRLAVAERDLTSPTPGNIPVATPLPSPTPTVPPSGIPNAPAALTPPPVGAPDSGSLPPDHIAFAGTAATLLLKANRPVVFAFYVEPPASPSPSPTASGHAAGAPSKPNAAVSGMPLPSTTPPSAVPASTAAPGTAEPTATAAASPAN